jgi:DNA-binding response OmpR family regulator
MKRVLVVVTQDDDMLDSIRGPLESEDFNVETIRDDETFLAFAEARCPDLLILDLSSSETNGLSVCQAMRGEKRTASLPIIMINNPTSATERVMGLDLGADDYLSKPVNPGELAARIRAWLRRMQPAGTADKIFLGDIEIDANSYELRHKGERLDLTISEYRILYTLCRRPGWVFTRAQLLEQLGQHDKNIMERTVDVHIRHIREKLGEGGWLIETVRGVGYKFERRRRQRAV